ncbi:ribonuclease P protein subunit p40 [Pseudoliparis swirei]|uniref:ribonuclease P protein subunit p40 n=1 Tax=Pseudoliparis swirei TaxID=2059687 RepID=UPI0024BDC9F0|nr:ribonuclease P protein subunit p40 [Pseudoliparis swirei]
MFGDLERTPRTLLVCERSSFLDEKNRLSSQVEQLHFNYKVSMLLPECSSAPSHLEAVFNSMDSFYLIRKLPIHELLDQHFLETAVHQGRVSGLSYGTRIDEDNCVALTPNGHLSLSLDKDSFEVLGVEGKPSRFSQRTGSRFVVSVDLTDSSMAPGGRGHQRLVTGLRSRLQLKTDFLLSRPPGGGASLRALLSRYDWSEHKPEIRSHTLTDLPSPLLTSDLQSCDPHRLLEWLGAVDAHVDCENSSSSFLSTLVCPEPRTRISRALRVSVCGLLRPQDVHRLIQQIRSYLDQPREEKWASLTVHGFVDSPVSWGDEEHGVLSGGDHFYSLLLFPDQSYQIHLATGAQDSCPP